jgi:hypothetical protein
MYYHHYGDSLGGRSGMFYVTVSTPRHLTWIVWYVLGIVLMVWYVLGTVLTVWYVLGTVLTVWYVLFLI